MFVYLQCMALLVLLIIPQLAIGNVAKLPNCADKKTAQGLVLVNTLDGKLTVLNYDTGKEIWSMETGPGPMLSSNIDRLELTSNGHWVRIIPSLSGSLYKFNGDTIDAIPITADNLLTASFRYSDDLVIAGGKEIRTYGVTLNSGKLLYECSLSGCQNRTENDEFEDLILVERNTHTVRAVEPRFGAERWNFSVGQLNIKLPQLSCRSDNEGNKIKFNLKTVVPEGVIYAFSDLNEVLWKKKFDTPIVNVWTWDGHSLKPVNLFTNTQYSWSVMNINNNLSPALYVGMHNKQLYVHESDIMHRFLNTYKHNDYSHIAEMASVSQIPWKPFPATSSALTVLVDSAQTELTEDPENPGQISTTGLSVLYASEYVNGNGFYLYTNKSPEKQCENTTIENIDEEADKEEVEEDAETPVQIIIVSLWYWWKEVAVIAITTACAVNLIITQRLFSKYRPKSEVIVVERHVPMKTIHVDAPVRTISESSDKEFISRYQTDFDPLRCLGKGGFGIVFEARNKIDECNYAVKRITLPNKQESRDRVMREVKILAKLEHRNIVRYFNAWLEAPPPDWINNFDFEWSRDNHYDDFDFSTTTRSPTKKVNSSVVIDLTQSNTSKCYNPLDIKHRDNMDSDSFIVFERSDSTIDSKNQTDEEYSNDCTTNTSHHKSKFSSNSENSKAIAIYSPRSEPINSGKLYLYIQMQLCRKESLKDWLREHSDRKQNDIINIFDQIVSAVEYVHSKGLIHRDLKPSNIFFSIDGEIKVGDFGLVTAMEECVGEEICAEICHASKGKHTKAVGTQLYMSPEQLKGLKYNYKVDIYSLGVILFELLVPFHTAMERNKTLLDLRKSLFPSKFCQDFQDEYQLLTMMLSENPDERPTSTGIRARPPLGDTNDYCDYHFELPSRQRVES